MTRKKIGVIIPTLNEESNIGFLLDDLNKQSLKPTKIYVIDGQSTDKTKSVVKNFKNATFVSSTRGVGHQRHHGAKKMKADILIFLDADTRIDTKFIENTNKHFDKYKLDIACAYYLPSSRNIPIWIIYIIFNSIFFLFQNIKPSGAGSFIAVRKNVYDKVEGFEGKYTYDDIHFIRKAAKVGKFKILPLAVRVSDRRFRNDGVVKTSLLYIMLSFFFLFDAFSIANKIKYKFGHYKN